MGSGSTLISIYLFIFLLPLFLPQTTLLSGNAFNLTSYNVTVRMLPGHAHAGACHVSHAAPSNCLY